MKLTDHQRRLTESEENRRAERFPIKVPMRYRAFGENDWHFGVTENISGAGIFFKSNQLAEVHKHVEIDFVLRAGKNERFGTHVLCLGEIVRSELRTGPGGLFVTAAKIGQYHLLAWEGPVM